MKGQIKSRIRIPKKLVQPVRSHLRVQLKNLKKRRKDIDADDPFKDPGRSQINHASPDTGADEQFGHDRASVIRTQIDRKIVQTRRALTRVKIGEYGICENCGELIDTDRLMIYPEATYCISCEAKRLEEDE